MDNKTITLFHGSNKIIEHPTPIGGKPYNDYGYGLYCTEFADLGREWAVSSTNDGWLNRYSLNYEHLSILNLNSSKYCLLHWLGMLLKNRSFNVTYPLAKEAKQYILEKFSIDALEYDIICGCRADDSYFTFAQDFLSGVISYRQLSGAMHLGVLGNQWCIKSQKAFNQLHFLEAEPVLRENWLSFKQSRNIQAKSAYLEQRNWKRRKNDLFIADIIDGKMEAGDERL